MYAKAELLKAFYVGLAPEDVLPAQESSRPATRGMTATPIPWTSTHGLPSSALIEVGTEHRLAEWEPLGKMLEVVEVCHIKT